jgi:Ca2+:H+ antiporter
LQTRLHRNYFDAAETFAETVVEAQVPMPVPADARRSSVLRHAALLGAYMIPVVYLAEKLAVPVDYVVETSHAPIALAGFTMAVLVATPEAISAVRAASSNRMQRSVNIFLGSVLSTIGLTIPAVLVVGWATHNQITLGLQHTDLLLFLLTLALCTVTFSSGRTNVLQGGVHLVLFATYLFFMFQG